MSVLTLLILSIIVLLLCTAFGVAGVILDSTSLVRNLKTTKHTYEKLNISFSKLPWQQQLQTSFREIGHKRLEEVIEELPDNSMRTELFLNVASVVWYEEKSLRHLYKHLEKISQVTCVLLLVSCLKVFSTHDSELHTIDDYAHVFVDSLDHLIPIIEVTAIIIILFRISAERQTIKTLLEHE